MKTFKTMPPTSPEIMQELSAINAEISAYKAKIAELSAKADSLPEKYTLEECRAMGCIHTAHKQYQCTFCHSCIHSKYASGAYRDYFQQKKQETKIPPKYPVLGWKAVACEGSFWHGEWHTRKVIKETERTLIVEYGEGTEQLLKSTISRIEDVTYIKDRSGHTYFCADDLETLPAQVDLLHIAREEQKERNSRLVVPELE